MGWTRARRIVILHQRCTCAKDYGIGGSYYCDGPDAGRARARAEESFRDAARSLPCGCTRLGPIEVIGYEEELADGTRRHVE